MEGELGDNTREESMSTFTSIEDEVEIIPEKSDFSKEREDHFEEDETENNNQTLAIATTNEKISQLSSQGYYLIPLPKGKSQIWQFFGMCSKDGVTVMPEHSGTVFCLVGGCTSPEIGYCGNTTNLYGHLERKHPDIEMPRKRNDKSHLIVNEYAGYANIDENEGAVSCTPRKVQRRMIFKFGNNSAEGGFLETKKRGRPLGKKDSYKRVRGESIEENELNDETAFYEESNTNLEMLSLTKNQQQSQENSINRPKYEVIPIASPMKPKETDKIYEFLIDYIITDHVGINVVKKKGFQNLLKSFNPEIMENFNINYDILTNKLKAKYQKYQANFKVSLIQQQIEVFSIMLEEWTSSNYVTSLEVSVSFVNSEWKIIHQLLANIPINPSQTNKQLTERITALLNEMNVNAFSGNKEIISTTSAMFQTKRMKNNILGAINIPSLELVLCTSLKEALCEGNCGRLLDNLNFEVENMRVLEVYRTVTTRLEEVLKQETLQNSSGKDQRLPGTGLKLTTKQWIEIKELRCELDKVSSFLSILNKMKHVPLSMLIPLRYKFLEIIKPYPNDSPLAESFKKAMSAKIESYYSDPETILLLEKSMWLDPRFKNLALMNNKMTVEEQVSTELQRLKTPETNENGQIDNGYNSLDNLFQSLPVQMETEEYDIREKNHEEIAQYNRCSSLDFKGDPLEWWKTMSNILPKLSFLAKKYQTIPLNTSNKALRNERSVLSMDEINFLPFLNSFYNNLK